MKRIEPSQLEALTAALRAAIEMVEQLHSGDVAGAASPPPPITLPAERPDDRLTPAEFAKVLGKSVNTVRKLIKAGEIAYEDVRAPGTTIPQYEIRRSEAALWRAGRRRREEPGQRTRPTSRLIGVPEVIH